MRHDVFVHSSIDRAGSSLPATCSQHSQAESRSVPADDKQTEQHARQRCTRLGHVAARIKLDAINFAVEVIRSRRSRSVKFVCSSSGECHSCRTSQNGTALAGPKRLRARRAQRAKLPRLKPYESCACIAHARNSMSITEVQFSSSVETPRDSCHEALLEACS